MPVIAISVLLVEDDQDDYIIMSRLLKEAPLPFRIEWCQTLNSGIEALNKHPFDIIILDLNLPDSNGWETFTTMHTHAPDVAVILMTGFEDDDLAVRAVHEGAQDYLVKGSVSTDVMVRTIQYAIERKATEAALRQYQDHLEDIVRSRTTELEKANAQLTEEIAVRKQTEQRLRRAISQLEEHDRAKTQFVTNVSHELKTPLASMRYAIENLLKGVMGPVPECVSTYLAMILDDAHRLQRTVCDILDLSRLEAGTMKLEQATIPFGRFIRRTLDAVALETDEREVRLIITIPDHVGFAACDATKMERVLLNVVRNAITYTDPGGIIEVSVSRISEPDDMLCVTIIDSGIGIPEAYLEKVTERYFRVGDHVDGTGLGLSIAKDIVALHDGTINIQSPAPDRKVGTCVSISIPAVAQAPTVIVLDEDNDALELMSHQLATDGYTVQTSSDPQACLRTLREGLADILLVNFVMPQIRGDALIAEVKSDHSLMHIPIVLVTGSELDQETRDTLGRFSVPALTKPWKQEALLDMLESTIIGK